MLISSLAGPPVSAWMRLVFPRVMAVIYVIVLNLPKVYLLTSPVLILSVFLFSDRAFINVQVDIVVREELEFLCRHLLSYRRFYFVQLHHDSLGWYLLFSLLGLLTRILTILLLFH